MKTTQGKAMRAYKALEDIQNRKERTTTKTGKALFELKRAMASVREFQIEREQNLISQYGATVGDDGRLTIPNDDATHSKFIGFMKDMNELSSLEIDLEVPEITIPATEELHVNMDEIEALDGFVAFE